MGTNEVVSGNIDMRDRSWTERKGRAGKKSAQVRSMQLVGQDGIRAYVMES